MAYMKQRLRKGAVLTRQRLFAAIVSLVLLAACSNGPSASQANRTLVVDAATVANNTSLDPARSGEIMNEIVHFNVYQSLLRNNAADYSKPYPSIASSYTASADAKTFTFTLNTNAKFSDGTPVTSADVVFSLNRNMNIKGNGEIIDQGTEITAIDSSTVQIRVPNGDPALPWKVAHVNAAILNSTVLKQHGGTDDANADKTDQAGAWLNAHSAGSGPYEIESSDLTNQIVLKANPNYWGTKPNYTRVVIRQVVPASESLDIQSGEAQVALSLSPLAAASLDQSKVSVYAGNTPSFGFLFMSNNPSVSKLTASPDFREAVRYGIDYNGLVSILQPFVRTVGFRPPGYSGALPPSEAIQRDLNRAKAALARGNFKAPTIDLAYLNNVQVNGVSFDVICQKIQADLKEVGITVNCAGAPAAALVSRFRAGQVPFGIWSHGADLPDLSDDNEFLPMPGVPNLAKRVNWLPGQNPDVDSLVQQLNTTTDQAQRVNLYQQLQRKTIALGYFVFLTEWAQTIVATKSVGNVKVDPLRFLYFADLT